MIKYSYQDEYKKLFVNNQNKFTNSNVLLQSIKFLCNQIKKLFVIKKNYDENDLVAIKFLLSESLSDTIETKQFQRKIKKIPANKEASKIIDVAVAIRYLYERDKEFYFMNIIEKNRYSDEFVEELTSVMQKIVQIHVQSIIDGIDEKLRIHNSLMVFKK